MTTVMNVWSMTTQEQVDYWTSAAHDGDPDALSLLAFWQRLCEMYGPDHVIDDLADVDIDQP